MVQNKQAEIDLWYHERKALAKGYRVIAGVDESGRGPLAGPVVAAAVILPLYCEIEGINDSKQLSPQQRQQVFEKIREVASAIGIGIVEEKEIDKINILQATYRAMRGAISGLLTHVDYVLVDGYPISGYDKPQEGIIGGDAKSASIAAASIVAKVVRDRIMCIYDCIFPGYGFAQHKGYPTEEHLRKLSTHGVCEIHRRSFNPIAEKIQCRQIALPWE
jgi:ribonuclease HII